MATFISHSPAETEALGETWGRAAERGRVIGLCGDLGAGKTQLVKGLARGLGISARVQSPSFTLVNVYSGGRLTLFHLDLFRLDTPGQIAAAGLEEYLEPAGVTVIEWADRWGEGGRAEAGAAGPPGGAERTEIRPLPRTRGPLRWVEIESLSEFERRIRYEDFGD